MAVTPIFNWNKTQAILKLETTMGTAIALTAADNDILWTPESISLEIESEHFALWFASGRHSQGVGTNGKRMATFKARAPLMLGASVAVAPKLGKAFKACGMLETVVASTSVAYTPNATKDYGNSINCTIGVIFVPTSGNAVLVTLKGCIGNVKFLMESAGAPIICDFEFKGCLVGITDGSALALTSPDTGYAPGTLGNGCTIATIAQSISKMELDAGNAIEMDEDASDATGYGIGFIAKRDPKLSLDPKACLLATDPAYTRLTANTEAAFTMHTATENAMAYTIAAPKIQSDTMKLGKRGSELTYDQTYSLHETVGNDEWSITQAVGA